MECLSNLEAVVQAFAGDFSWVVYDYKDEVKNRLNCVSKEISGYLRESL